MPTGRFGDQCDPVLLLGCRNTPQLVLTPACSVGSPAPGGCCLSLLYLLQVKTEADVFPPNFNIFDCFSMTSKLWKGLEHNSYEGWVRKLEF